MVKQLTPMQEKFAQNVASGMTYSNAYRGSYNTENYKEKSIHEKASQLMGNVKILARIEELREGIAKELHYTAKESFDKLEEMRQLALTPNGVTGKMELAPAIKAEELKGKLGGLYVDQVKNTGEITTKTVFVTKEDKKNADNHIDSIINGN